MRARSLSFPAPASGSKGKHRVEETGAEEDLDDAEPPVELNYIERSWRTWLLGVRKRRKKLQAERNAVIEIVDSIFVPFRPASRGQDADLRTLDHAAPLDDHEYRQIVESIRTAIQQGRHPKLNVAGSSGSYLVKDTYGQTTGIFKPKDEDPYGRLNPKWIKWFHRVLLSPLGFGFGRACLIPNFSYLSEAGASLLDRRLGSFIVPYTDLASFSSRSFYYDYIDRHAAHRKEHPKPLPEKPGSLQLFAHGFRDASDFLSDHPWPGRLPSDAINLRRHRARQRRRISRFTKILFFLRREDPVEEDVASIESLDAEQVRQRLESEVFEWTAPLMEDFRLQLEKLVILDVLLRNTDRGLDNFMVKHCAAAEKASDDEHCPTHAHMHVAAIDNSLAFPHKHPTGWRNYTYGWLWLPASLIGEPFSRATREHYLSRLTSPHWWAELTRDLRVLFAQDTGFNEKQFRRQMAVIKGQAYNIVQTLSEQGEGPVELSERSKCMVWDDLSEVVDHHSPVSVRSDFRPLNRPIRFASASYTRERDEEDPLLPHKLVVRERREEIRQTAPPEWTLSYVVHFLERCMARLAPETLDFDHVTRPTLQRLTSSNLVLAALGGQDARKIVSSPGSDGIRRSLDELASWKKSSGEGHREALLHKVERGDTVAGLALQYGLSAQALRQANRLWSNDSIHLRETLYIPLDSCTMPPAKELIERIEIEGDKVTIYSRALPKRPAPPVAPPPPRALMNGAGGRRSTSLDLERLPTSSRTSMESNASFYLPETNTVYTEAQSPTTAERLVEVEEPPAPLKARTLKLGLVPLPPSTQPFFRLSPSASTLELPVPPERKPVPITKPAKAEAVPMKETNNQRWSTASGWSFDDESELAMAEEYMRRTTKGKRA